MGKRIINYDDSNSLVSRLRKRRITLLLALISEAKKRIHTNSRFRILDVGGTHLYWKLVSATFLEEYDIEIDLLNLTKQDLPAEATRFSSITGNACDLSQIADRSYDLVHSNSVIEHVGSWQNMRCMASEMSRVGRAMYVQTPYFWFPIEPHFLMPVLHWLPMSIRSKLAMHVAMGNWPRAQTFEEAMDAQLSAVLLDKTMFKSLFPDCSIMFERFLGLPKSLIAVRQW